MSMYLALRYHITLAKSAFFALLNYANIFTGFYLLLISTKDENTFGLCTRHYENTKVQTEAVH